MIKSEPSKEALNKWAYHPEPDRHLILKGFWVRVTPIVTFVLCIMKHVGIWKTYLTQCMDKRATQSSKRAMALTETV
jgi:hypothetical protein